MRWAAGSIPTRGGFHPERIIFDLGTAGFLLSCLPSLFDFGSIRSWQLQFPLSNLFLFSIGKLTSYHLILLYDLSMKHLQSLSILTCHRTACQVLWASRFPWDDIVDRRVWPADFLTAGLRSTHKAPEMQKTWKSLLLPWYHTML
jgi:hypothetical protein